MSDTLVEVDVPFKRKMVSVQAVDDIQPIEGADNIVVASILGWKLVTQKSNDFKVGDLVAYFEIDSFLPIEDRYEFLRKSSHRTHPDLGEGFKIKTIKLRGQISQGLILPLADALEGVVVEGEIEIGDDLTEVLGVRKWDIPAKGSGFNSGIAKGNFPWFIRKTDQERVQNLKKELSRIDPDELFEATLKLDGSSMTVYHNNGETGVCSRNLDLTEDEGSVFWKIAHRFDLINTLKSAAVNSGLNIAIQGEAMGPGIQKNREGLKDLHLFVFDIWDIDQQRYYTPFERTQFIGDMKALYDFPLSAPLESPSGYLHASQ